MMVEKWSVVSPPGETRLQQDIELVYLQLSVLRLDDAPNPNRKESTVHSKQ